jgi:hypothetical protein
MKNDRMAKTPECTILWPAVFEPESFKDGDEKYRAVFLFDEDADLSELDAAILAARDQKFRGKDAAFLSKLNYPYRSGDEKAVDGDGKPDKKSFFYNRQYLSAKSNFQPQVVDKYNQPITNPDLIYGGCRVVALLQFYGYDHLGNRGVSCALLAIMKRDDGPPIGGGKGDTGTAFAGLIEKPASPDVLKDNLTPPKRTPFGAGKAAKGKWKPAESEDLSQYRTKGLDDINY